MGHDLGFIAFDNVPELSDVRALKDWRLFKRLDRSEWYLDGPQSKRFPDAILFERPVIDKGQFGRAWVSATNAYETLSTELKGLNRGTFGLDYKLIPIAVALSEVLQTRLLMASGNDEDLDCAFICAHGRLLRGQFLVGEAEAMMFHRDNGSHIVSLNWEDEGHLLYGLIATIAVEFFGSAHALDYVGSWEERSYNGEYQLTTSG